MIQEIGRTVSGSGNFQKNWETRTIWQLLKSLVPSPLSVEDDLLVFISNAISNFTADKLSANNTNHYM